MHPDNFFSWLDIPNVPELPHFRGFTIAPQKHYTR